MSQAIRVKTTKPLPSWPAVGADFEFESVALADKILGEGTYKITSYADESEYHATKAPKADKPEESEKA